MMTEQQQAEALRRWLDAGGQGPPPQGLDPEVLETVYALRPELAPPPTLSAEDILADVATGPFATADEPEGAEVVPFPVAAALPETEPVAAPIPEPTWWRRHGASVGALAAAAAAVLLVLDVGGPPATESTMAPEDPTSLSDMLTRGVPAKRDVAEEVAAPAAAADAVTRRSREDRRQELATTPQAEPAAKEKGSSLSVVGGKAERSVGYGAGAGADEDADAAPLDEAPRQTAEPTMQTAEPFEADALALDDRAPEAQAPPPAPERETIVPDGLTKEYLQKVPVGRSYQEVIQRADEAAEEEAAPGEALEALGYLEGGDDLASSGAANTADVIPEAEAATWRTGLSADTLADLDGAFARADRLATAGDPASAGRLLASRIAAPQRAGQEVAHRAATYALAAGDPRTAQAWVLDGLSLGRDPAPERTRLMVLLEQIQAALAQQNMLRSMGYIDAEEGE